MIYGKFSEFETQEKITTEGFEFEGTLEEMQNILMESAQDMYEIQTGLLIADVVIEESVLESAVGMEEIESVMEGVVKDGLTNLKELFIKLRNKVVAWFKKAIDNVKIFFSTGEKFVNAYGDRIRAAAANAKDFEYEGIEYTPEKGFAKTKETSAKLKELVAEIAKGTQKELTSNLASLKEKPEAKDYKEEINAKFGVKAIGEITTNIKEAFGKEKDVDKKTIKNPNFGKMLAILQNKSTYIKDVESIRDDATKSIQEMLDLIDSAQRLAKSQKDANKAAIASFVSQSSKKARTLISLNNSIGAVSIKMIKEVAKNYEAVLKKLIRTTSSEAPKYYPSKTARLGDGGRKDRLQLTAAKESSLLESIIRGL